MTLILGLVIATNIIVVVSESSLLTSCKEVLDQKNKMVSSENELMSTYFSFKSYHAANNLPINKTNAEILLEETSSTSVLFIEAMMSSI